MTFVGGFNSKTRAGRNIGAGRMNSFGHANPVMANIAGIPPRRREGCQSVKFNRNDFRVGVAYKF